MRTFGLIGNPLTHSFSAKYFEDKFHKESITGTEYRNFPVSSIEELPSLLDQYPEIEGLNVTIPFKEEILAYLDETDELCREIGAANTITIKSSGTGRSLKGYNTDEYGFRYSLLPLLENHHRKALIFGTGGASKAVEYVLRSLNIDGSVVSRNPLLKDQLKYSELDTELIGEHFLLINTTPLGMFPDVDSAPQIPYAAICEKHLLYDLIYNPAKTVFLKKGEEHGARIINGLSMLRLQAERSWEIWNT